MTKASIDHTASCHDAPFRGRALTTHCEIPQGFREAEETAPLQIGVQKKEAGE